MKRIVHSLAPITMVGGGVVGPQDLDLALTIAPRVVAVDGGALPVFEAGLVPDAVVGDLDSLPDHVRASLPHSIIHSASDQNYTDFDKALRAVAAPVIVAVGFSGGRIDHQLAVFHTLVARAAFPCVVLGETEVVFHLPRRIELSTRLGDVVSLFPMACVTGRSHGLEWPIDGLAFAPDQYVGTSNRATGPCVIEVEGQGLLAIVPRRLLGEVTRALGSLPADARWPARVE
jgi:thiamine pyrophosphokinase